MSANMPIHTKDFVCGCNIKYRQEYDKHILEDETGHTIELELGDAIIWVSKSHNQGWIDSGIITQFGDSGQPERILCDCKSINLEGNCFVGLLYED